MLDTYIFGSQHCYVIPNEKQFFSFFKTLKSNGTAEYILKKRMVFFVLQIKF
jgi:hypothetical protein